jgi:ABC-type Na+ efflux pump permease subunit
MQASDTVQPSVTGRGWIDRNPIARAELDHIDRYVRAHPRRRWIMLGLVALGGAATAVSIGLTLIDSGFGMLVDELRAFYPVIALAFVTLFVHFMLLYRLVNVAGESVVREKRSKTWESLILTGIPARRFVFGKWLAVLRAARTEIALLTLLRVALCIGLGQTLFSDDLLSMVGTSTEPVANPALQIALAVVLIVMFTLVNALFTVAAGVAASFVARTGGASGQTAMAFRMTALLLPVVLVIGAAVYWLYEVVGVDTGGTIDVMTEDFIMVLSLSQISLLDNGSIITGALASPYVQDGELVFVAAVAALTIYAGLAAFMLWLAVRLAKQQGMIDAP